MLWLSDTRDQIKRENPGISVTDLAKKAGEMWKELKDKSKWEEKAAKDKQRYLDQMKSYKPSADSGDDQNAKPAKKRKKESPTKKSANTSGSFKSKEYISDDDDSSSVEADNEAKKSKEGKTAADTEKKKNKTVSFRFFVLSKKIKNFFSIYALEWRCEGEKGKEELG